MLLDLFKLDQRVGNYLLVGQVGSKAYGTDTPESDDDLVGIAVAPLSHYTGLDHWENDGTLKIDRKETDNAELTAFELKKFLRLALGFNPNVIPLLYLRKQDYQLITSGGQWLIDNRDAFNSKRAYKTMIGYAESQRKAVINGDTGKLGMKRKELVKQFGYDVKYASHTVRLLTMAVEFFAHGEFKVYRTEDQELLKDIRAGYWTLEQWLEYVDVLIRLARGYEMNSQLNGLLGNLPDNPDYERVNDMCMYLIRDYAANHRPNMDLL